MAQLAISIDKKENIPANLTDYYIEADDGKFVLDVDNSDYKTRIAEFRDNNVKLSQRNEELEKVAETFKDLDASEARKAIAKVKEYDKDPPKNAEEVEKEVESRVAKLRDEHEQQVQKLSERAKTAEDSIGGLQGRLQSLAIKDGVLTGLGAIAQIVSGAENDVSTRAAKVWHYDLEKSQLVARDAEGRAMYGKDGVTPLTVDEWGKDLVKTASHLFTENRGGGGTGSGSESTSPEGTISGDDPMAIGRNLEAVASGKMVVEASQY